MPPATMTCASPARIAWAASMTACRPEPHTRLTAIAPTVSGTPPLSAACRARRLAQARRDHVAEDHVLDVRGVDAAALQRCADRDRTELGCLETRKSAEKAADRRARRSHDHGRALRIRHIYGLLLLLFAFCELGPRATGPGTASDYRET